MWSFRKELHKISGIGAVTAIPCDQAIQFTGNQGIFIFDINIGTELGNVNLNHDAFGIPDRFQIEYDGVIVADSLYVGNSLTGNPPDLGGGFVGNTYNNVPEFFWDGTQFVANGNTQNLNITQLDVAPFGQTAGANTIFFQKITSIPSTMTVRVFAPLGGTAWNLDTECPDLVGIGCSENLAFSSPDQAGTYYTNVELGLDTGLVTLDYDAANIPDRFQIMYDGVIVADSLHVGGFLTGNPPDANTSLWEGGGGSGQFVGHVYNGIPDYIWDGATFVASGPTTNNTVLQTDVAPFGQTAGAGTISFPKPNALPSSMTVIVTSFPANTGWNFDPNCPVPLPVNPLTLTSTSLDGAWQADSATSTGLLTWDITGGVTANDTGDTPIFDFSANAGTANVSVTSASDVTQLELTSLDIQTIDVTNAVNLVNLNIFGNNVSVLDISNNIGLTTLTCRANIISVLDVSNNIALTDLTCDNNNLSILDVSANVNLTGISCGENNLTALDVSNNIDLDFLVFNNNSLTVIDVTSNPDLEVLSFTNNSISVLDVTNNTLLQNLTAINNSIAVLDLTNNTNLTFLNCSNNSLTALNTATNVALATLACTACGLTNLDITSNVLLTTLRCNSNALVAVDIDNIIIQLDTNGLSNGFLDIPVGRTAASDAAKTSLQGKGWTVTEI